MGIGLSCMNFHLTSISQEPFVNPLEPQLRNYYNFPKIKSSFKQKSVLLMVLILGYFFRVLIEYSDVSGETTASIFRAFFNLEKYLCYFQNHEP